MPRDLVTAAMGRAGFDLQPRAVPMDTKAVSLWLFSLLRCILIAFTFTKSYPYFHLRKVES